MKTIKKIGVLLLVISVLCVTKIKTKAQQAVAMETGKLHPVTVQSFIQTVMSA